MHPLGNIRKVLWMLFVNTDFFLQTPELTSVIVVKVCRITKHICLKIQDPDFNAEKLRCTIFAAAAW